jgi:hypothetical protein
MGNRHENESKWGYLSSQDFRFLAFDLIYIFEQVKRSEERSPVRGHRVQAGVRKGAARAPLSLALRCVR